MDWLFIILRVAKYVAPALLLWAMFYQYRLQYISPKSEVNRYKKTSQIMYRILFFAGLLGLAAIPLDDWDRSKKEKIEEAYRISQDAKLTNLNEEYGKILMNLATNPTPNPALLSALAQAKERFKVIDTDDPDLKMWASELKNKRDLQLLRRQQERLKAVDEEKIFIAPSLPIWNYTMKTFVTMLDTLAKRTGANLSSGFTSLPSIDILCPGPTDQKGPFDDLSFHVADISIRTNLAWNCRIIRKNNMLQFCSGQKPTLIIERRSTNGIETVQVYASGASLFLPGDLPIGEQFSASDYKTNINAVLRGLIAAAEKEFSNVAK